MGNFLLVPSHTTSQCGLSRVKTSVKQVPGRQAQSYKTLLVVNVQGPFIVSHTSSLSTIHFAFFHNTASRTFLLHHINKPLLCEIFWFPGLETYHLYNVNLLFPSKMSSITHAGLCSVKPVLSPDILLKIAECLIEADPSAILPLLLTSKVCKSKAP